MTRPRAPAARTSRLRRYDRSLTPGHGITRIHDTLTRWHLDDDGEHTIDALLVAGELLANAHQHGGGIQEMELCLQGARLRISVNDTSPKPARVQRPHGSAPHRGHGLHLVDRLATRWGSWPHADGKTVWAELDVRKNQGTATAGSRAVARGPLRWLNQPRAPRSEHPRTSTTKRLRTARIRPRPPHLRTAPPDQEPRP